MVLHGQLEARGCLVENTAKIDQRWCESYCIDSEDAEKAELDGEDLIGTGHLHRDAHGEFFVLILRWLLILLDEESTTRLQDAAIRPELRPDLEAAIPLDEAQRGVELEVRLEVLGERELNFHRVGTSVV